MSNSFSIIMPIYNREKCLRRAIQSVMKQSFQHWELILINDGSTDGSEAICAEFVQADTRIQYRYQSNAGPSAARNTGLGLSSGDYILFLDSDDYLQEDTLKILDHVISVNHAPDLVAFGNRPETGAGWSPSEHLFGRIIEETELKEHLIPAFLNLRPLTDYDISPMVTDKCYRHSLLKDHGIAFDNHFYAWEDGLFNAFVLKQVRSLAVIPDQLYVISDGGYESSDHSACRFFPNMPQNWVRQFELVESIYAEDCDFSGEYGVRAYWNIYNDLLERSVAAHASGEVFSFTVSSEVIQRWVRVLKPQRKRENLLFAIIKRKNARLLQFVYRYF